MQKKLSQLTGFGHRATTEFMRVLYINSPECDYMQDLLYSGLVKVCGAQNVYDYPFNRRYHYVKRKYPRNLGFNFNFYFLARPFRPFKIDCFDLVIVGSCKHLAMQAYVDLLPQIPSSVPVVLIEGGDHPDIGGDLVHNKSQWTVERVEKMRPFDLIFKREFFLHKNYCDKIIPLPFCANMDRIPSVSQVTKKYDVSFWAVESHPIRTQALSLLQDRFDCRENGTVLNQRFHYYKRKGNFYLEELHRCKIVLNLRGNGWDTMRYWEVPAMKTLMVTQKPGIYIPNDFVTGKHVIHCQENLSDLIELCQYYLDNEQQREKIAVAGYQHLLDFHTDIVRAQTVIETVGSRFKISAKSGEL